MNATNRREGITVKKLDMNSPDFREENMCLTDGTPQERWDAFWDFVVTMEKFFGNDDFNKPLRRDVVRKTCWAEIMKEEEQAWAW